MISLRTPVPRGMLVSLLAVGLALLGFRISSPPAGAAAQSAAPDPATRPSRPMYLFTYFTGNGEDGLHLAWSADGYRWQPLNDGRSYLHPQVGESKLMRDPCLVRGPDGTYHLVWTTSWGGQTIGYAHSRDLVNWSEQKAIPVMAGYDVLNTWAPEIVYDAKEEQFVIFWASTVRGKFPETQGWADEAYNHRMYVTTTKDFDTFTPTTLLYDPGFPVIDMTYLDIDGRLLAIIKDETRHPAKKHLRVAAAESYTGPFGELSEPITRDWVEGPSGLKVGEAYLVYFDLYTEDRYGAVRTRDGRTWEDVTEQVRFPQGMRHGTAFEAPADLVEALRNPAAEPMAP